MNLSAEQKSALRECFAKVMAKSAELQRERALLLPALDVRMARDDGHTTERISQVRALRAISWMFHRVRQHSCRNRNQIGPRTDIWCMLQNKACSPTEFIQKML